MFEPLKDDLTIVVIGNWNVSIFSPKWVGESIFDRSEITLDVGIDPGLPRKLTVENVVVIPMSSRLMVTLSNIDDTTLKGMENAVCKILTLLIHTPVSAVGINFGYKVKPLPDNYNSIFPVLLANKLASEDLIVKSREIKWTVDYEKQKNRRLNISNQIDEDEAIVKFNFHSDIKNAEEAIKSIQDKVVIYRDKTLSILDKVFGEKSED